MDEVTDSSVYFSAFTLSIIPKVHKQYDSLHYDFMTRCSILEIYSLHFQRSKKKIFPCLEERRVQKWSFVILLAGFGLIYYRHCSCKLSAT
jgi:hypothetical protein